MSANSAHDVTSAPNLATAGPMNAPGPTEVENERDGEERARRSAYGAGDTSPWAPGNNKQEEKEEQHDDDDDDDDDADNNNNNDDDDDDDTNSNEDADRSQVAERRLRAVADCQQVRCQQAPCANNCVERGGGAGAARTRSAEPDQAGRVSEPLFAHSGAQSPGVLNLYRNKLNHTHASRQAVEIGSEVRMLQESHLDALMAAGEQPADLLEVLQLLSRRRDELRLIDKKLFDLMAECCTRLESSSLDQARGPADPIDLSTGELAGTPEPGKVKRPPSSPTCAHIKKMRLLSAARCTQSPGAESRGAQQAAVVQAKPIRAYQQPDSDDEGQRPELKKFFSIGTAEICREQYARQQRLFDATLAKMAPRTLADGDGPPHPSLEQSSQQQHSSHHHLDFHLSNSIAPQMAAHAEFDYHQGPANFEYLDRLATMGAVSSVAPLQTQQCQKIAATGSLPPPANQQPQNPLITSPHQYQHLPVSIAAPVPVLGEPHLNHFFNHHQHYQDAQLTSVSMSSATPGAVGAAARFSLTSVKEMARKMNFKCHVCQSCFEDRHRLQQHLSIHLNLHSSWFEEKTIKETMDQYELRRGDYLCQVCQVRYETTSEFDRHMHLHGDKPHQCHLCTRENKFVSFRYFRQLLTHLRSHCFLYSCKFAPECRQTANRKDYLKLHILKHHLNNKLPEQFTICCH